MWRGRDRAPVLRGQVTRRRRARAAKSGQYGSRSRLACEDDQVGPALGHDRLGIRRLGDQADRPARDAGLTPDSLGERVW